MPGIASIKCEPQTAAKHAFVGRHPLDTEVVRDGKHLFGDAAFRRPHAVRSVAKYLLVQIESALQLLSGIFGIRELFLRKRKIWSRDASLVCIAHQRQDRVIKRRG